MKRTAIPFLSILLSLVLCSRALSQGDGLNGKYYSNWAIVEGAISFSEGDLVLERTDANIDFWEGVNPNYRWEPVAPPDSYGVAWTGAIYIEEPGDYGFGTVSDDGSQVWIDGALIVDNSEQQWWDWEDNIAEGSYVGLYPAEEGGTDALIGPLYLAAGFHSIEVTFYEAAHLDGIELWWLRPGAGESDIPYYGRTFHQEGLTYNGSTNWEIVSPDVLYTSVPVSDSIEASSGSDSCPGCAPALTPGYPRFTLSDPDLYEDYITLENISATSIPMPLRTVLATLEPESVSGYNTDGVGDRPPTAYWAYSVTSHDGTTSADDVLDSGERIARLWQFADEGGAAFEFWADVLSRSS